MKFKIYPGTEPRIPMHKMKIGEFAVIESTEHGFDQYNNTLIVRIANDGNAFAAFMPNGEVSGFRHVCNHMVRILPKGTKIELEV